MKERISRLRVGLSHIGAGSIAAALAILLVVASVATYVGTRVHAMEKEILQQRGELNARESAMEYGRYLLTRENIVTLVGYTVDDLLASGADNAAVEQYLTAETGRIIATLDPTTTGLYGWINEQYLDGAGWAPDEDYVPTERPWYTETLNSNQTITFVEPYLDAQTGTVMMTVSELLKGGRNVVAMDVSLDQIQQIVERISSSTEGSQAFVLDVSGVVVVHSDKSQLGRNYLEEADSLGGAVARRLLTEGQRQFDLRTAEGNYSVYIDELEGDWYSVSLINADIWYRPLRRAMTIFFAILGLAVLLIIAAFLRLNAKNLALRELNSRIDQEEKRGERLQALSETDRMTGLYDRVSGKRRVDEVLAAGGKGMFLEVDIDKFKSINDTCGHQAGDAAILALSDALCKTFRARDIIMRLGGDEFAAFAVTIDDREVGKAIVQRLFNRLETIELAELCGGRISVSVGAALCAKEGESTFESLYACADGALYMSKKIPGNSLTFGGE